MSYHNQEIFAEFSFNPIDLLTPWEFITRVTPPHLVLISVGPYAIRTKFQFGWEHGLFEVFHVVGSMFMKISLKNYEMID
jgi:hypothetical protein